MRYRCKSCKEEFDVPEGDRARCPSCLRIHDVEPVERPKARASRYKSWAVLGGVVALALGGYALWYVSQGEGEGDSSASPVEVGPLAPEALAAQLRSRGLEGAELVSPFAPAKEVTAFARGAARGAASTREKVQGVHDGIRALLTEGHEPYIGSSPRASAPRSPADTLAALGATEPFEPSSFELAALMVTALRALDVDAALAEVFSYSGEDRPADSSGTMGHFAVAVPEGGSFRRASLHDPTSGRAGDSAAGESEVLTDLEAAGALLGLKALHEVAHGGESSRGERFATLAVRLRPRSATALAARGTVLLMGGGGELSARAALEEYERALTLRSDPQRKLLVARVLLAARQIPRAEELVRGALEDASDYAAAHGLLGLIHAAHGRLEEAQASILRAEQLEPRDPYIGLLWVQVHVAQHDLPAAAEAARAVVDRVPDDPQPRLMLAQVLWEDARYEAAQAQLRELLRREPDNARLHELVREVFGFDPFDESGPSDDPGALALGGDGEDAGAAASPEAGPGTPAPQLQMGKGLGKIRLGGPSGFQLNVDGM